MVDSEILNVKHIADIVGEWGKWQKAFVLLYFHIMGRRRYQ
jgi:hypothetical protein